MMVMTRVAPARTTHQPGVCFGRVSLSQAQSFRNPAYDHSAAANAQVLTPPEYARVWTGYFNRWAASSSHPTMWTVEKIL